MNSRLISRHFFGLLAVVIAMLTTGTARAQSDAVTLDAELSRSKAFIGEVVTYQVLVRGMDDATPPDVQFPDSVIAEYRGASSQKFTTMRSVNGRQRSQTDSYYKHQYLLTVVKEGEVLIPPAVLRVGTQRYQSEPVRMTALLPELSIEDRIVVELPDRPIYAGETVLAHVSWWIADQTSSLSFDSSIFPSSFKVSPATPSGPVGQEHELRMLGQSFLAYVDSGIYQGQPMTRLRFDLVLTPTKPGDYEFGPVRVVFSRQDDFARASRQYAESQPEHLSVIAVPSTDRPSGYQGLIGVYGAMTDASNTSVNVGDPIELRLLVSGQEPMIGLEQTLDAQSLNSQGFRVSPDGWHEVERRRAGERLFTTTIRATDDSITEIPAITLPAFNPETGAFEVFASEPIPLQVQAVRRLTLNDAVTSGQANSPSTNADTRRAELARNPSLLWANPDAQAIRASSRAFSLRNTLSNPVWIATLSLIVGVPLVSGVLVGVRKRRDPHAAQIQRAWKHAKRLHAKGDDVGAIRVYGGAILGIDPESLTGADLKRLEISEEIVRRSAAVLSESESMHYGSLPEARTDSSLLRAMRRDFLRHESTPRANTPRRTHR